MMSQVADSWQYEKFSSAKEGILSESPPLSPTLYSQTNSSNIYKPSISKLDCNNGVVSAVRCNPGVIIGNGAKTLLTAVSNPPVFGISTRNGPVGKAAIVSSGYQTMMDDMTDLGTLTEESFNLEGFEYLDDLTSDMVLYDSPQGGSTSWSDETSINNESSISLSPTQIEILPLETTEVKIKPESEFQVMLENLGIQVGMGTGNGSTVFTPGELEEFGILTVYENLDNEMEIEDIYENDTSSNKNQQQTIVILSEDEDQDQEEEEEDEEDDFQSQSDSISQPSSVISIIDSDDDTQIAVADALVRGDIKAAEAFYPSSSLAVKQGKAYARILSSGSSSRRQSLPASVVTAAAQLMSKPAERRGRKPSTASTGKPWIHVKDKNLRKKEQNKTAATKYRQKKKTEQEQFLLQEKVLTVENNELKKQNEELRKEINIIKGILRNLCNSKKQKQLKRIGKN